MTDPSSPLSRKPKSGSKGTLRRWLGRGLLASIALGCVGAAVLAFMPKPVPVEIVTVERGLLRVTVDEDGKTRVIDRYVVSAPLAGHMARLELHPGDSVEVGTLLATLEPIEPPLLDARSRAEAGARLMGAQAAKRQANAAVERAKLSLEYAKKERDRSAGLVGKNSASARTLEIAELDLRTREQELESARFGVKVAAYEVEVAKATLARIDDAGAKKPSAKPSTKPSEPDQPGEAEPREGVIEVRAPIEGRVLRVLQEQEGVVQLGTPLIELADPSALEVVVDVLTTDAVQIQPGDLVLLRQWGGDQELRGRVRLIEPSAFTKISALGVEEQRVNVIIDLDQRDPSPPGEPREPISPEVEATHSPLASLGDGYRVEVSIVVWEGADVVLVPVSALFRDADGWAVWTVVDGVARTKAVHIGQREGLVVEIVEGLGVGDPVIVHPSDAVIEGVEVEVQ